MPSEPDPHLDTETSDCDESLPSRNANPPTPFELASLAVPFLVKGENEDEAFRMARKAFGRAEEEVRRFKTYEERTREAMLDMMPHQDGLLKENLKKIAPILGTLRVQVPSAFPIPLQQFYDLIFPQQSTTDRRKWFEKRFWPRVNRNLRGPPPPVPDEVPDIHSWVDWFVATSEIRGWHKPEKLQADSDKLHSYNRRSSKQFRPRRTVPKKNSNSA